MEEITDQTNDSIMKKMLSSYYGIEDQTYGTNKKKKRTEGGGGGGDDIDSSDFDADGYAAELLRREKLSTLLKKDNEHL